MADLTVMLAYALVIGIPMLIIGFGSMVNESSAIKGLAIVNFLSILTYYTYIDKIPGWVAGLFILGLTLIFIFLFKSVLGETA